MNTVKKTMNKRVIVSLALLASLIMTPVSAVIVHVTHGKEIISHAWLHLHVLFGFIFVAAGIYHIVNNWRTLKYYLMGKR
jgi:predicted transporter